MTFCGNPKCELGLHQMPAHPGFGIRIRKAGMELILSHQTVDGTQYCDYCAKSAREQQYADEARFREAGKAAAREKLEKTK